MSSHPNNVASTKHPQYETFRQKAEVFQVKSQSCPRCRSNHRHDVNGGFVMMTSRDDNFTTLKQNKKNILNSDK